jgi:hypothetical protein
MLSDHGKNQIAPGKNVVEGAGHENFSLKQMYLTISVVPLVAQFIVGASIYYYPLFLAAFALPVFAFFQIWSSLKNPPMRPQKNLPGLPLENYLQINSKDLYKKYNKQKKIPIETFFESYFDGDIDIKRDMLELLEDRYDWAAFTFTFSQIKFFLSQFIPETIWHSRTQDEDQVREHYDRGDDFYNWFCKYLLIYNY